MAALISVLIRLDARSHWILMSNWNGMEAVLERKKGWVGQAEDDSKKSGAEENNERKDEECSRTQEFEDRNEEGDVKEDGSMKEEAQRKE